MSPAVSLSTSRFRAIAPPNAASLSAMCALRYASASVGAFAAPQGLLCFTITAQGVEEK